eukprot:1060903-Rhodomonas_salina.1
MNTARESKRSQRKRKNETTVMFRNKPPIRVVQNNTKKGGELFRNITEHKDQRRPTRQKTQQTPTTQTETEPKPPSASLPTPKQSKAKQSKAKQSKAKLTDTKQSKGNKDSRKERGQ